ncbi:MAG TPA: hypothetical protein VFQ00_08720 [Terriglobales bacterium]|nr:hypothetical protein [Terriglobales bacterium]
MSVEKVSSLRSKLEELRSERQKIVEAIREHQRELEEIDGVIARFLRLKANAIQQSREKRTAKKK